MKKLIYFFAFSVILFSCKKDKSSDTDTPDGPNTEVNYSHGSFVVNEGGYMAYNASITYIATDNTVYDDLYYDINDAELGDVLQSFEVIGSKGYAVLNNSQKLVVVDMKTFQHKAAVNDLTYPRYIIGVGNNKAYLTNGSMDGDIKVIDLNNNTVSATITVGKGPEKLVRNGDYVYVCNSGGWDIDSTVTVINSTNNSVVSTLTVGDRPIDAVVDSQGNIWVLCSGNTSWMAGGETAASLYKINGSTKQVEANWQIGSFGDHPQQLEISPSGNTIYYQNGSVYSFDISGSLPGSVVISESYGSLSVNPTTGDIWCASISDYTNPSTVYRYNSSGSLIRSYNAGLGTSSVSFN